MRKLGLVGSLLVTALAIACGNAEGGDEADDSQEAIGTKNTTAAAIGLKDKEIVLTLDDGPGPRTVELAEWLAREKVPAVFFMVGKNAKANPAAVARVVQLSNENDGLFIVANHSMNHQAKPLPSLGTETTIHEIMDADAILKTSIAQSQSVGYPSSMSFFRPPYGDLVRIGATNIARINAAGGEKYSGPVFWDIGGELKNGYSADWACWGKVGVNECADGYIREATARKRGIMLAHDVHAKTVDMLIGTNSANGQSLIKNLRAQGFKFVSIRSHEANVQQFTQQQEQLSSNADISIDASVEPDDNGKVKVDVKTTGGAKMSIAFDNTDGTATTQLSRVVEQSLSPGQHFVTVTVFDAAGVAKKQSRYPFIMPAEIRPDSHEATSDTNAVCVNFSLMKAGQLFRMYHGKVACDAPGAQNPPFIDECYKYKGTLKTTRDPRLVGASDWSVEFDLSYRADPTDKSKVTFVMDATSGEIETGKRFFPGNPSRKDVAMTLDDVKCEKGEWRGKFTYANGTTEDVLFRTSRDPRTGGPLEHD